MSIYQGQRRVGGHHLQSRPDRQPEPQRAQGQIGDPRVEGRPGPSRTDGRGRRDAGMGEDQIEEAAAFLHQTRQLPPHGLRTPHAHRQEPVEQAQVGLRALRRLRPRRQRLRQAVDRGLVMALPPVRHGRPDDHAVLGDGCQRPEAVGERQRGQRLGQDTPLPGQVALRIGGQALSVDSPVHQDPRHASEADAGRRGPEQEVPILRLAQLLVEETNPLEHPTAQRHHGELQGPAHQEHPLQGVTRRRGPHAAREDPSVRLDVPGPGVSAVDRLIGAQRPDDGFEEPR